MIDHVIVRTEIILIYSLIFIENHVIYFKMLNRWFIHNHQSLINFIQNIAIFVSLENNTY